MATSTNYGWSEPDNTSLVKDGALAIRTLGDAIDTSLWNSGYGQAGKNKIINGDFGVWQRGTSFTNPASSANIYTADRWVLDFANANPTSASITQQTFTPGAAPVAGYEGRFFARSTITTVGSTTTYRPFCQRIEDVRTFANQTATLSFWAKADSNRTLTIYYQQVFGSGGSSAVSSGGDNFSLTSSWQRFTITFAIPSISGKTIGTNSYLNIIFQQASASGSVLDLWGVQMEYGSSATPFQTASGGSIQGELAMCQRYYIRFIGSGGNDILSSLGWAPQTTSAHILFPFPVQMRTEPAAIESSSVELTDLVNEISVGTLTLSGNTTSFIGQVSCSTSGLTQMRPYVIRNDNNAAGYVAFIAEL